MQLRTGDLVTLKTDRHNGLSRGAIGIVTSVRERAIDVTFSQGSRTLPSWELKLLTKEIKCN